MKKKIDITTADIVWIVIHMVLAYLLTYLIYRSAKTDEYIGEFIRKISAFISGCTCIDLTVYKIAEYLAKDNLKSEEDKSSVYVVKPSKKSKSEKKIHLLKNAAIILSEDLLIGQEKEITCPSCGHNAVIGKTPLNGYLYGQCNKCSIAFVEKKECLK